MPTEVADDQKQSDTPDLVSEYEQSKQAPAADSRPDGLVEPGNVNLTGRPILHNSDGTISSEKSFSIGTDKGETLLPLIVNGKELTQQQAVDHYRKTGEHMGIFDTPEHADAYAEKVHNRKLTPSGNPVYVYHGDESDTPDLVSEFEQQKTAQQPAPSKADSDAILARRDPLGPGSVGYTPKPPILKPSPSFAQTAFTQPPSVEDRAAAARASSPQAAAEKAAGMHLAPVAGQPQEPQGEERINAKTGTVYHESAVPEAEGWSDPLIHIAAGAEPIATGLSRYKENDKPVYGTDPKNPFGPPVRQISPEDEEKQRRQRSLGAAEVIQGAGQLGTVAVPASLAAAPFKVLLGYGAGLGAREGLGAIVHGKVSPEDEEVIRAGAFFLPTALGVVAGLKSGTVETPQGKFSGASVFGGKARAGVGVTPDVVTGRVKFGDTQFEITIPRNGGKPAAAPAPAPPLDEATAAMVQYGQANGEIPKPAPPTPPVPLGQQFGNKLSGTQVDGLSKVIAEAPENEKNSLIEEAHTNISKWILDNNGKVFIDGKIHMAKSPDQVEALAAKIINDASSAHDKNEADLAKANDKAITAQKKEAEKATAAEKAQPSAPAPAPKPAAAPAKVNVQPKAEAPKSQPVAEKPAVQKVEEKPTSQLAKTEEPTSRNLTEKEATSQIAKNEVPDLVAQHEAAPDLVAEHEGTNQRKPENAELRARFDKMSPEERSKALVEYHERERTSEKTGLPNLKAFKEDSEALRESHPHVGDADIDDFKDFNTVLGKDDVDSKVLPVVGEAFQRAIGKEPGGSIKVYHRSGDEFSFLSKDKAAIGRVVERVNQDLAGVKFTAEAPDGTIHEKTGAGLSHGTGTDTKSAEHDAKHGSHPGSKQSRKEAGLRSGTRDKPGPVGEKSSEGKQAGEGREGGREEVAPAEKYKPGNPFAERAIRARKLADQLSRPSPHDVAMEKHFPLGVGFGRPGAAKRIDASVDKAVRSVEASKNARYLEAQAEAFDRGEINAQGRRITAASQARSEKREAYQDKRGERVAAAKAAMAGKQKWEVPAATYADSTNNLGGGARQLVLGDHREAVEKALAQGKEVPAEVLKDYPDLKPAAREPISTAKQEAPEEKPESLEEKNKRLYDSYVPPDGAPLKARPMVSSFDRSKWSLLNISDGTRHGVAGTFEQAKERADRENLRWKAYHDADEAAKSPARKAYDVAKKSNPDAVVLAKSGDFYETFGGDAEFVAKLIGKKTSNGQLGIPYHEVEGVAQKLIRKGRRVALADKMETEKPKPAEQKQEPLKFEEGDKSDATMFARGVQHENNRIADANDYGRVAAGVASVLDEKDIQPNPDYIEKGKEWGVSPFYRELTDLFHDPLSSLNPKMPIEQIGKAMEHVLPLAPVKVDEGGHRFKGIFDNGHTSDYMRDALDPESGRMGQELDKADKEADAIRRKADIVYALRGGSDKVDAAYKAADETDKQVQTLKRIAEQHIKAAEEVEAEKKAADERAPITRAEQVKPLTELRIRPSEAWTKDKAANINETTWITDGHLAIDKSAATPKGARSLIKYYPKSEPGEPGMGMPKTALTHISSKLAAKATLKAEPLGYLHDPERKQLSDIAYFETKKGLVAANAHIVKLIHDVIGTEGVTVKGGTKGDALVFEKGGKPAAVVMPLRAQPEIDIPTAKKTLAAGGTKPATIPASESRPAPGARAAHTGNETGLSEIEQLTNSLKNNTPKSSLGDRLREGAKLGAKGAAGELNGSIGKLKGTFAALIDALKRPPKAGDYEDATGKWSGADQRSALYLNEFTKAGEKSVPSKLKQEAISNWIEAGGDDAVLQSRADQSKPKYKPGYEAALKLTDAEKTIARNIMGLHDATLQEAIKAGILEAGTENYIQHIYDQPKLLSRIRAEMNFNSLQTKPSFSKKRTLPTYFDAEQLGFTPKNKSVFFLTAAHERSLREALAARDYVRALMDGKAEDGRPLTVTNWASAKEIEGSEEKDGAYVIKANIKPGGDFSDYLSIDHPALRKWNWSGEIDGKPVFVQGDVLVHPDIYRKLKNNLGTSALRRYEVELGGLTVRPGAMALNAQAQIKQFVLSFSGFHQTTLGVHALEHKVLPAGMPELDLNQPEQSGLVDGGLMVAHYDAMEAFGEGVSSGGLVTKIPAIGPMYKTYTDYLFKSYMPRLKMQMALAALKRNQARYPDLSKQQLYRLTASQANAAFGGLNYRMLGRNKTFQDTLRLILMAPDFTEARARFAAQAAKPYGREQLVALMLGAAVLYTVARIINEMSDGEPHWDKPFSVVRNGKEYELRTIQSDMINAATDPKKFLQNRVSPPVSALFKNEDPHYKKKNRSIADEIKARADGMVPVPVQPWMRNSKDSNATKAMESILKMVGVNSKKEPKSHR